MGVVRVFVRLELWVNVPVAIFFFYGGLPRHRSLSFILQTCSIAQIELDNRQWSDEWFSTKYQNTSIVDRKGIGKDL